MPSCRNCTNSFPNRVSIDGKVRNLSNRTLCLDCSPFGTNHFKLKQKIMGNEERICQSCQRKYMYKRNAGHSLSNCNTCRQAIHRKKVKARAIAYKGGKCKVCSYNKFPGALEFHHLDPSLKNFEIGSDGYKVKWEKLQAELDKCILLCSNCHAEVEGGILNVGP
jgi:hypothetical protein